MFRALYTAATGMMAQQLNLDNVANNLSNSSTAGFRSRRLQFQDLIYQNLVTPGAAATQSTTVPAGLQIGLGTRTAASEVIQTQGDFDNTGNPLDMAIQGAGFFQVKMPDGETAYTRAGMFHLDNQGNMVTADGNPLDPQVTIPADALTITDWHRRYGQRHPARADPGAAGGRHPVGDLSKSGRAEQRGRTCSCRLQLREIPSLARPEAPTGWDPTAGCAGAVQREYCAGVYPDDRGAASYEANSRVITAADQMLQQLNNLSR